MKGSILVMVALTLIILMLSACNLQLSVMPTEAPSGTPDPGETDSTAGDDQENPKEVASVDLSEAEIGTTMRWYDNSLLMFVPEGEFVMGATNGEDNPIHTVFLDAFWVYKTEVTNDMYRLCVAAGACSPPADEIPMPAYLDPAIKDHPVVGVDWGQAGEYCEWMNARLPTEAEWEKTARGPEGNPYPWGFSAPKCDLLNFHECARGSTSEVSEYSEGLSYYEVADMAGNVYEWVGDRYQADYYNTSPEMNPPGPETGTIRVVRGSSFKTGDDHLLSSRRVHLDPETYREDLGFRCVVTTDMVAGFAPFCQVTAHVSGLEWGIEPPSGEAESVEAPGGASCTPERPSLRAGSYCSDQESSTGGATLTFEGEIRSAGAECEGVESPVGCIGPEGNSFDVVLCTSCFDPALFGAVIEPTCHPPYTLVDGICEFAGVPPEPGGFCLPGWFYDPESDSCQAALPLPESELCPDGYSYVDPPGCCVALFSDPVPDWPGVPPHSYPGCPIGSTYDPVSGACILPGADSGGVVEECETFTVNLGYCADPGDDPGDDDGCQPQTCSGQAPIWCAASCSCIGPGDPCP